ncbi:MAG: trehalose-6-phosphate synthase [Alphaproteobacteria bacterium]|nr:trehalose-6-phosphate synthase [Alphaproteobacteria bacterium]
MAERLVIVSNRVPLVAAADDAQALGVAGADERVLWFGWSGRLSEKCTPYAMPAHSVGRSVNFVGVDLSTAHYEGHLNGFANGTLWPLFHDLPDRVRFHAEDLAFYRAVNAEFAKHLSPLLRGDDRIWIHDYHLIPLAGLLRQAGVKNAIGLFLHVPFPSPRGFLAWPWHKKFVSDFAAYDLIGFQTRRDARNFDDFMRAASGRFCTGSRAAGPRAIPATGVFPVGVHTRLHMASAASEETATRMRRLEQAVHGRQTVISVDRLDYTKGLLERLRAYEDLLDQAHEYRGASTLVQVTLPSRPLVPGYLELRMEQQALVERINARHLTRGWMPVLDIFAKLPQSSLAALYRLGHVGLATPLRDGVNLTAKEYVAAQDPADPGALVLSRHAGAGELLTEAILVDPGDPRQMTQALRVALAMPLAERQDRWRRMIVKLLHHDAVQWHQGYVAALALAHRATLARTGITHLAARPAANRTQARAA